MWICGKVGSFILPTLLMPFHVLFKQVINLFSTFKSLNYCDLEKFTLYCG